MLHPLVRWCARLSHRPRAGLPGARRSGRAVPNEPPRWLPTGRQRQTASCLAAASLHKFNETGEEQSFHLERQFGGFIPAVIEG
jgi:hypothetical protein